MHLIGRVRGFLQRQAHVIGACLLALVLRLPAVFNGLPYIRHPDEPVIYSLAHRMVAERTLLPGEYTYPSLHFELNAVVHGVVDAIGRLFGTWHSIDDLDLLPTRPGAAAALNSEPWVAARLVTVAVALVGVALVVVLATRLSASRRWGAVAGALAAISGIGISTGSVVAPDALAGTTTMAVIVMAVRLHGPGAVAADRRWALLTGAMLGLAVGSKYNSAVVALLIVSAVALAPATRRPNATQWAQLAAAAGVTFLLSTPGALFEAHRFVSAIRGVGTHYSQGHAGYEGDSLATNLGSLWRSDGLAMLLAVAAVALHRTRAVLLLGGWVVLYLAFTSVPEVHFERNLTPLLGAVAVLGALGAQRLWTVARVPRPLPRRGILVAVCLVALMPPAWLHTRDRFNRFTYDLTDHEGEARRWLIDQLPVGAAVLTDIYTPWLDAERYRLTAGSMLAKASPARVAEFATRYDAVVFTSDGSGRFTADRDRYPSQAAVVDTMRRDACDMARYEDAQGHWIEVYFQRCP